MFFFFFFDMIIIVWWLYAIDFERRTRMKKKLLIISLCGAMLMMTGCGKVPKLKNGEEVAASIDGKKFTANDLFDEMKQYYGTSILVDMIDSYIANKEVKDSDEANQYADSQIKQLKQQYESGNMKFEDALVNAGFKDEKAYKDYVILSYKKDKVVEKYLENELTKEEIQKHYDEEIFGEITAQHILIKPDVADDATEEQKEEAEKKAKEKAEELIKKINDGEDFGKLAKENSDDEGTASEGGKLTFSKDQVVSEFWEAANKLKDKEVSKEPVKSTYGYHIILKNSQKEKPKLKDVESDIKDTLVANKISADQQIKDKTWVKVREKYKLKIEDSSINKIYKNTVKSLEK